MVYIIQQILTKRTGKEEVVHVVPEPEPRKINNTTEISVKDFFYRQVRNIMGIPIEREKISLCVNPI